MAIQGFQGNDIASLYASLRNGQVDRINEIKSGESTAASKSQRPAEVAAQNTESAKVQLSGLGKAQAATANVQAAGRDLQDEKRVATADDARKAAESFANAYNEQREQLAKAGQNGDDYGKTAQATAQMQRFVSENSDSLRAAGIVVAKDGSLSVDAKSLESAYNTNPDAVVRSLGSVGRAAEVTTTRQLDESGSVGSAVKMAEKQVDRMAERQSAIEFSDQIREQSARWTNDVLVGQLQQRYGFNAFGASAYLGIFGL